MVKIRNILLIVADQWRGDHLPRNLGGPLDLPTLDGLAAQGTSFVQHYSNASPCGPARMCMFTGQYAMNHRVVQNGVPLRKHTRHMAELLRGHGHLCGLIGYTSWLPDPTSTTPDDPRYTMYGANMPGFSPVQSFEEPEFEAYFAWLKSLGYDLPNQPFDVWDGLVTGEGVAPSPIRKEHSDTAWMTDAAKRFINGRRDAPWMLMLGYWRPHPPMVAPAPYHALHDVGNVPRPVPPADVLHPLHAHMLGRARACDYLQGMDGLAADLCEHAVRNARAVYRGMISEIDDQLARLFDTLKRAGHWDNTLVIFTSDHGEMLGDQGLFGKESTFDSSFHVPLIIRDPRPEAQRGAIERRFTEHVDILPTILAALGHPIPRQCDGNDLGPLLRGGSEPWRESAFMEVDFRDLRNGAHRGLEVGDDGASCAILRGRRWKYVHAPGFPPQLYDIQADPHERANLADDPAHGKTLNTMRSDMLDWRISRADRSMTTVSSSPGGLLGWPPNRT